MIHASSVNEIRYGVHFNPYGIKDWSGHRYLEFFQVEAEMQVVSEIWLGHLVERLSSTDEVSPYVIVGTIAPDHLGPTVSAQYRQLYLAEKAVTRLSGVQLPPPEVERPAGFGARLGSFISEVVERKRSWQLADLCVDNTEVETQKWSFADGVAAYSEAADVGILPFIILAYDVAVESISLESLSTAADYGVDLSDGLMRSELATSSTPVPSGFHADYGPILHNS